VKRAFRNEVSYFAVTTPTTDLAFDVDYVVGVAVASGESLKTLSTSEVGSFLTNLLEAMWWVEHGNVCDANGIFLDTSPNIQVRLCPSALISNAVVFGFMFEPRDEDYVVET
jgi:hypothetical protein